MKHYDCAVIGTGPGGQKAAIQASKLGKRVCVIEKNLVLGGAGINTGTIPSKSMREAALHLTGASRRGLFGDMHRIKRDITIADLIFVSQQVINNERKVIRDAFDRNGVDLIWGAAHFEGPNLLQVQRHDESELVTADKFIIATGTRPARPASVPFDGRSIFCSDGLLELERLPKSIIVVGGGVVGTEYACIMATLGVRVTLIEGRQQVLGFLDHEICEAFQYHMRQMGITLRMGEKVQKIEKIAGAATDGAEARVIAQCQAEALATATIGGNEAFAGTATLQRASCNGNGNGNGHSAEPYVLATLESGKHIRAQTLLYSAGRQGNAKALGLENIGLEFDERERISVNEKYQTALPHVYAVGDIIGFPALASTSMEQGRLAACHAFGVEAHSMPELFPYGVYAVPEISMVGKTEQQLTEEGTPYEIGIANYREIARGQILGDETGMLKLLVHQETHHILGVHAIGTGATELIHIGQAVMALGGRLQFFLENVFNFPTLAEAYKVAALNAVNRLKMT